MHRLQVISVIDALI